MINATIKISEGAGLPHYYTGLRVAWFGAIWTGAFFEIWTTVAGWYVRKYGANHRESALRSFVAVAIPAVVVLVAWVPPIILCIPHGQTFNRSFRVSQRLTAQLLEWQRSWSPGDGIDLAKLYALVEPGAELGDELRKSHRLKQICSYYCTAVLFLTFVVRPRRRRPQQGNSTRSPGVTCSLPTRNKHSATSRPPRSRLSSSRGP